MTKQTGLTDMVYPRMTHSRFEHSLGVMHLATKMCQSIYQDRKSGEILKEQGIEEPGMKRNKCLIRIAALVHDVGHFPFSHALESNKLVEKNPKTNKTFTHENYTAALVNGRLKGVIEDHKINKGNFRIKANEIAAIFQSNLITLRETLFWKEMIASQLDADTADYLQRDSHYAGVTYGVYDLDRLLETLGVGIDPETGFPTLGVYEKGWQVAEAFIIARYKIFTQVYLHKTRRAFDIMLQEATKEAIGKFPSPANLKKFIDLDDFTLWNRMRNAENNEWFRRIKERNHI